MFSKRDVQRRGDHHKRGVRIPAPSEGKPLLRLLRGVHGTERRADHHGRAVDKGAGEPQHAEGTTRGPGILFMS